MVVNDEEDEEEWEHEKVKETLNMPMSLDRSLATVFSLNLVSPDVAAMASTSVQAQGPPVASSSMQLLFLVFLFIYDCTMLQVEFPI